MTLSTWWQSFASSASQSESDHPLTEPAAYTNDGQSSLWKEIKAELDIVRWKPARAEGVVVRELEDRAGKYHILKNPATHSYLRLSPSQFWIWERLDGRNSVQDIVVAYFQAHGTFAFNLVVGLVQQLHEKYLLRDQPTFLFSNISNTLKQRTIFSRLFHSEHGLLTRQWVVTRLDEYVAAIYRVGGKILFSLPAQILLLLLAISGLYVYTHILGDPRFEFLTRNLGLSVIFLYVAAFLPIVLHEFGHALTTKHFGREVNRGGLVLTYGLPSAFVDITDIVLENKRRRLIVTWAGPYTGILIGSTCAILLWFSPETIFSPFLFQIASIGFVQSLLNLNPVLNLDGYYLLSDALEVSKLRGRALAFFRNKFISKILKREAFSHEERIFLLYGLLAIAWAGYIVYLALIVYKSRFIKTVESFFIGQGQEIRFILNATLILLAFALLFLARKRFYHLAQLAIERIQRTGFLFGARRVAILLSAGAALLSFLPYLTIPEGAEYLAVFLGIIAVTFSIQFVIRFAREMRGTAHARSWIITAFGFLALGIAHILWGVTVRGTDYFAAALDVVALALVVIAMIFSWRIVFGIRGSWRATSLTLFGAGWLSLSLIFVSRDDLTSVTFHLFSLLLLVGGLIHWQMTILSPPPSVRSESRTVTANSQLWDAFRTMAESVLEQMKFSFGRGMMRFAQRRFNSIARTRDWGITIADGKVVAASTASGRNLDLIEQMTVAELGDLLAAALSSLLYGIAHSVGDGFARHTLQHAYDSLSWDDREVAGEYLLRQVEWAEGLAKEFAETRQDVVSLLKRAALFADFTTQEVQLIAQQVRTMHFARGENIIRQGDPGDNFYIIRRGRVSVVRRNAEGYEELLQELVNGDYFGETALLTGAPRNATVRAATPVAVFALSKKSFDQLVRAGFHGRDKVDVALRRVRLLNQIPIFADFDGFELKKVAGQLKSQTLEAGQVLFHQGDLGDNFYIVESGEVIIRVKLPNGEEIEQARLGPGEYFGEIALLKNVPRTATVLASEKTNLLALDAESFNQTIRQSYSIGQSLERAGSRRMLLISQRQKLSLGET